MRRQKPSTVALSSATPLAQLSIRERAHRAGREMSARSVMFYTVVAEQLGLGVSDLRAWDLLLKDGPIMASRFAELTGLTPGAVTGLVDRLVKAGVVKRTPDQHDRRKVIISVTNELRHGPTSAYFNSFQAAISKLYRSFTDEEVRFLERYHIAMSAILQQQALLLRAKKSNRKPGR